MSNSEFRQPFLLVTTRYAMPSTEFKKSENYSDPTLGAGRINVQKVLGLRGPRDPPGIISRAVVRFSNPGVLAIMRWA